MGKIVRCTECGKVYRDVEELEDVRDNDSVCLVCNSTIEITNWDRILSSYEDGDGDGGSDSDEDDWDDGNINDDDDDDDDDDISDDDFDDLDDADDDDDDDDDDD